MFSKQKYRRNAQCYIDDFDNFDRFDRYCRPLPRRYTEEQLSLYYTGARCFWIVFVCGMLDIFLMAFLVHGLRCDGLYAVLSEMVNPVTVGGVLLGGLLMGFLITMEPNMILAFTMQIGLIILAFIGLFFSFVDVGRDVIVSLLSNRSDGFLNGLLAVIDLMPNGRLALTYVVLYGLAAYFILFTFTKRMRRSECTSGQLSGSALCATLFIISLFFISAANNLVVRNGTVSVGDIVEETLVQNRFLVAPGDIQLLSEGEIKARSENTEIEENEIVSEDTAQEQKCN